jgi:vancomycin resistance protein YoaR
MTSITVDATPTTGKIYLDGQELTLLGTGHSDFSTSIWSRMVNVRKAVSNVHNAIVEPGEVFSFNDILDYPIAPSNGWPEAKVIFGGWELRDAPGGGICQSSTTTYRAAAYAGLPILKRKNHSLYVHYYEKHGIGLDATVFPGKQDFTFLNDTGAPLVLQAFTDGFDAYVHIYGKNDGRAVTLEGPYFGANAPADMLVNNRPVRRNEIVWVRTISRPDGTVTREQFVSNYNAVPTSIVKKYTEDISMAAR